MSSQSSIQSSVANYYNTPVPSPQQSSEPEEKFGQVPVFMDGQLQILNTEKAAEFPPPAPSFKNLFGFLADVPEEAITPYTVAKEKAQKARVEKAAIDAGYTEEDIDIKGTQVSEKLGFKNLARLGFVLDDEQFINGLNASLGEGKYRYIIDKEAPFLSPKYYVSVIDENTGEFSKFSPVTPSFKQQVKRYAPSFSVDIGIDTAAVGTSLAAGAYVGSISGNAGVITGPAAFLYTLYTLNQGAAKGKNFLREELDLKEDEANSFIRAMDGLTEVIDPTSAKVFFQNDADEDSWNENFEALLGTVFSFPGAIADRIALAMARAREVGLLGGKSKIGQTYKSSISSQITAERYGLSDLILSQINSNKIIQRLTSLSEQTTIIIPNKLKEQMQSAVNFLQKETKKVGTGDFNLFRKSVLGIRNQIDSLKTKITKTGETPERLGTSIAKLEQVFKDVYRVESLTLYNKVFDQVKNASYDLTDIVTTIKNRGEVIIPTTPKGVVKTGDVKYDASLAKAASEGNVKLNSILEDIMLLGKNLENGNKVLNPQALKAAVSKFKKDHPESIGKDFKNQYYNSPAKILQLYSSKLREMSRDIYSEIGTAPNNQLATFTYELGESLLNKISNPIAPKGSNVVFDKDKIAKDLLTANEHYKRGFDLTGSEIQIAQRTKRKLVGESYEKAEFAQIFGLGPTAEAAKGPTQRFASTISNINAMSEYILKNKTVLKQIGADDPLAKDRLQSAFAEIISQKMKGSLDMGGTKLGSVKNARDYLNSFTKEERLALGIDDETFKRIDKDLIILERLEETDFLTKSAVRSNAQINMDDMFAKTMKDTDIVDVAQNFKNLILNAKTKKEKDNLRAGLLNYIISTKSGVLKEIKQNSPYGDVGDLEIDVQVFGDLVQLLKQGNAFGKNKGDVSTILTFDDKKMLDRLVEYVRTTSSSGADAGSALAGAQIIGNLFTLDPGKFVDGLARLHAQGRIARLFTNKSFVQAVTGTGKPLSTAQKLRQMFFGKGALGNIIASFSLTTAQSLDEQTDEVLNTQNISPAVSKYYSN
jgi:hypothetical protein